MTMSEDLINKEELQAAMDDVAPETEVESTDQQSESEYTETELEAMEHGWNPEGVEGKRNLTAEEFMDRKPLYDEMHSQRKEIRKLKEGIEAFNKHIKTVEERAKERAIEELKVQKKQALADEDYDTVVELDEKIAETKAVSEPDPAATNRDFEEWADRNEWYHQNEDMRKYADMIGFGYYQQNRDKPFAEVYSYVTDEVKKRFPDKFQNPNRSKPAPVEGARKGRVKTTAPKYSSKDLPESDREIMRTLIRTTGMSEDEYLKQYYGE